MKESKIDFFQFNWTLSKFLISRLNIIDKTKVIELNRFFSGKFLYLETV